MNNLSSTMVYTKFQGHRSIGLQKIFAIYGHGAHVGHVTRTV